MFLWFYIIWFVGSFKASVAALPESEYLALYDFYNSTIGTNWRWRDVSVAGMIWEFSGASDPCQDGWQGVTCSGDTAENHLIALDLQAYRLRGTLPASLQNLVYLQHILLDDNRIGGKIPDIFDSLPELYFLSIAINALTGRLPDSIGHLSQLFRLELFNNQLTGPIPDTFRHLTQLGHLTIKVNRLTGPIPEYFGDLTNLVGITLGYNHFTGTLPVSLSYLPKLEGIILNNNHMHGPIPAEYSNISMMYSLYLGYNHFTGHVPPALAQIPGLVDFYLDDNMFSGPLHSFISSLTSAAQIDLANNKFSGTIPESIGRLTSVQQLLLQNNQLHGSVPAVFSTFSNLMYLYLNENQLTGVVPDLTASAATLQYLYLSNNLFSGPVPHDIGTLNQLLELDLSDNLLTGRVPASINALLLVQVVNLANNKLVHVLPTLRNLTSLVTLSLQGNRIEGSLDHVFNSTTQTALTTIQLNNNQFTGTIPSLLFDLPSLVSLTMVGSCMHGTLPPNICSATKLEALILYGLRTGSTCRHNALHTTGARFSGTFPSCLLQLPSLRTLLLSSNGLTGTIPAVDIPQRLLELDLSHNRLSGSIPHTIQNHTWYLLDLAHNKLDGVLQHSLFTHANLTLHLNYTLPVRLIEIIKLKNMTLPSLTPSLSLTSNRLSGHIPNSVKSLRDVTMLGGNLFECSYDKSDLPSHDSGKDNYECASNTFNVSIFVWLGLILVIVSTVGVFYWYQLYTLLLPAQVSVEYDVTIYNVQRTYSAMYIVLRCSMYCTMLVLCIMLPYYGIVSTYKGTHTHQYAYQISAIYNSGILPFVCNTLLLGVLMYIVYYYLHTSTYYTNFYSTYTATWAEWYNTTLFSDRSVVWSLYFTINTIIVSGVNIGFVYIVLYESSAVQLLAQILLSLFKLLWNVLVSPKLLRWLALRYMHKEASADTAERDSTLVNNVESSAMHTTPTNMELSTHSADTLQRTSLQDSMYAPDATEPFFLLELLVALFNNIAIPCLVVAAIDPNCFSTALLPADSKTVDYLLPVCQTKLLAAPCFSTKFTPATLQFDPPFTYSYQCSASFVTSYAPTFVYMSISNVFLVPVLQYLLLKWYDRMPAASIARGVLSVLIPDILLPTPPGVVPRTIDFKISPLFDAAGVLVNVLTQLGILLTFGAMFPPVALAMAVSIAGTVYMTRYKVQRFLHSVVDAQQFAYVRIVNSECAGVGTRSQLQTAWCVLLCTCCTFYMLFLFDTLGDSVGFAASAWVLFVVPLAPLLGSVCMIVYSVYSGGNHRSGSEMKYTGVMDGSMNERLLDVSEKKRNEDTGLITYTVNDDV